MAKIETTWKLLFDGPQGLRLIVEYHSGMRPEEHEATHKKLVEAARKLLALRPEFLGRPARLVPIERTETQIIVHPAIVIDNAEREKSGQ